MKINEYFDLEEFVPEQIFKMYGEKSIWFIDPKVIKLATFYREYFKVPIVINNWHKGGEFQYRGYRPPNCKVGAQYSQHKFGRAFDCNGVGITPQFMYEEILKNKQIFIDNGLTTLENIKMTPTWLHSDVRSTKSNEFLIVEPQ